MCGIVGTCFDRGHAADDMARAVAALGHRGPDDTGLWQDQESGVLLGHTRLSIIDLSAAGHQPMVSACGRYVMTFNGEIFNHGELRARLGAPVARDRAEAGGTLPRSSWRGQSDTETLLEYFAARGPEETLRAAVGQFALALWDRSERRLVLARDRLGEKPLYYGFVGQAFAFASELKALRTMPGFTGEVDRHALALFARSGCVPAPYSIYSGIFKVPPGTWLEVSSDSARRRESPAPRKYWSALDAAIEGSNTQLEFESDADAVDALEDVLGRAVAGQLMSDVPLGAFLSGGIDSSLIVSLMQAHGSGTARTFSIGFHESGYDEAQHASAVARHLGTEHTELYVNPEDALAVIPELPRIYDEPFADSSQIPTYLVAAMARRDVTVALSGDGGDELFGGYWRYGFVERLWSRLSRVPAPLRSGAGSLMRAVPIAWWDSLAIFARSRVRHKGTLLLGDKMHKASMLLDCPDGETLYRELGSGWSEGVVSGGYAELEPNGNGWPSLGNFRDQMMAFDSVTYLPDDILTKVDRATMAVSLEARVPLLDHNVFEFAWRLPQRYKVRGDTGKWILRELLSRYVPLSLVDRPKTGFAVPIDSWLRGPLRAWAEELLDESRLRVEGFFDPAPIRRKLSEHLSERRNWHSQLWSILMFQSWLESQRI